MRSDFLRAKTEQGVILDIPRKIKSYDVVDVIGNGGCGIVVSLKPPGRKEMIAAKVMKRPDPNSEAMMSLEREVRLSVMVQCPYLVNGIDVVYLDDIIVILMEYVEGQSLVEEIAQNGTAVKLHWKKIFGQLCLAVQYLHGRGLAHRDIKLDNVIVDKDFNVKLCDYGIMCEVCPTTVTAAMCGTVPYMAPEIVRGEGYSPKEADVWALGVVLFTVIVGVFPWKSWSVVGMQKEILTGMVDVGRLSSELSKIVLRCCDPNVKIRATIDEIVTMIGIEEIVREEQLRMKKVLPSMSMRYGEKNVTLRAAVKLVAPRNMSGEPKRGIHPCTLQLPGRRGLVVSRTCRL